MNTIPIDIALPDARAHIHLALPSGWTWQQIALPQDSPAVDPEGRVTPRLIATSEDGRSKVTLAVSHMPLPMGLTHAVVYWCSLYELDALDDAMRWETHEAHAPWTPLGDGQGSLVGMSWMQSAETVIELRIEGPQEAAVPLENLRMSLRQSLQCEAIGTAEPMTEAPEPWWSRVQRLREQGQIDEALAVAERDGDRAEVLLVQADLHAERLRRAQAAGNIDLAREAWRRATNCAHAYAACATSGGEGAARSLERDRVLAELGPEPE